MIPLSLVIARRGNARALREATAPRVRPSLFSADAILAAAFVSFLLGALFGAGLAHAFRAPTQGDPMYNTRVERLADTREDEKDNAAPPHFECADPRCEAGDAARARRDIDRWIDGGEPFRDGGIA